MMLEPNEKSPIIVERKERHVDPPKSPRNKMSSEGQEAEVGRWLKVHCTCIKPIIGAEPAGEGMD